MENAGLGQAGTRGASTCSLRSLMVFCISRTKSLKSFVPSPCGCSEEEGVAFLGRSPCSPTL